MRVFDMMNKGGGGQNTLYISPAAEDKAAASNSEWVDKDGKPKQLVVKFTNGETNVPDDLGRFLIAKGYARKTRPLLRAH